MTSLLPFDIFLKAENKKLFRFNVVTILKNDLQRRGEYSDVESYINNYDGYRIRDTHFKIGSKVHSEDFYYAKQFFLNSFYTNRLAADLARKILCALPRDGKKKIMLVGYEMYSELLLSLIKKYLKELCGDSCSIEHIIARTRDGDLEFLPNEVSNRYLNHKGDYTSIIIVPIAATGSTSKKIEKALGEEAAIFTPRYNIVLAADSHSKFDPIRNAVENQEAIIHLPAKWHAIEDCEICYVTDKSKPLFDTDGSSLTPSLIFGNPQGQTEIGIDNKSLSFNDLSFKDSLKYQEVNRNNNYRIFDIDSDTFIEKNKKAIEKWLYGIKKDELNIQEQDKIVIIAPCHESNSKFINMINDIVFSSSATIIHHQHGVDYSENFKLLNKSYLERDDTKIVYVDDSLITGTHFFELRNLIEEIKNAKIALSIFLNDQSSPTLHQRVTQASQEKMLAFSTYNLPPVLSIGGAPALEHERLRYVSLQDGAMHDVLREHFRIKEMKLKPPEHSKDDSEKKKIRHLRAFAATHLIYDYFTKNKDIPDLTNKGQLANFVVFDGIKELEGRENAVPENRMAMLKVLSQYPFVLHQELKEATFKWHKDIMSKYIQREVNWNGEFDDMALTRFKFLLRRSAFLDNYQVLQGNFLSRLAWCFSKTSGKKTDKYRSFPIFVLGNYVEMIHRNGWTANHLLIQVEQFEKDANPGKIKFKHSHHGRQFVQMLQVEAAVVVEDFVKLVKTTYPDQWWKLYYKNGVAKDELENSTAAIVEFFNNQRQWLKESNKYKLAHTAILKSSDWNRADSPFVNYLWTKQFIFADLHSKAKLQLDYREKVDNIVQKMRGFFKNNSVEAFFVVTDMRKEAHILKQCTEYPILNGLKEAYKQNRDNGNFGYLINFLKGIKIFNSTATLAQFRYTKQNNLEDSYTLKPVDLGKFLKGSEMSDATETTAELRYKSEVGWENSYTGQPVDLGFIPHKDYQWLYLIRLSELNIDDSKGKYMPQGVLGFYAPHALEDPDAPSRDVLAKQLLMLLRRDISSFIKKHHQNDEFSHLMKEKEKSERQIMSRHGFDVYDAAMTFYENQSDNPNKIKYIFTMMRWVCGKTALWNSIQSAGGGSDDKTENLLPKYEEIENINLHTFIRHIEDGYKYILTFKNPNYLHGDALNPNSMDELVNFDPSKALAHENFNFEFPEQVMEQIVFEAIYNIRKHAISKNWDRIKNNKLLITLSIMERRGITYLSIANNYCPRSANQDRCNMRIKGVQEDGLNLIYHILHEAKIGDVFVEIENKDNDTSKNTFTINIPLKTSKTDEKYEEDKT